MKRLFVCLLFLCCFTLEADAASKFWVGGGSTTNWNAAAPTNWANTSGGAGNQSAPIAGDAVSFDANSGTGAAVWNTAISLASLDCTGSKNLVSQTAGLTISSGDLIFPTGVGATYTTTVGGSFTLTATAGTQHITTSGFSVPSLTFNGVGGTFQFLDNFISSTVTGTLTLTNGTLDAQGFNVTIGSFASNNSNIRVLKGSGTWTVGFGNTTGPVWSTNASTNLDLTNFTITINITGSTLTSRNIAVGSVTTYKFNIAANASGGTMTMAGGATFGLVTVTGPNAILFSTNTFTTPPVFNGSRGSVIMLLSTIFGNQTTITLAAGTMTANWIGVRDLSFTGGATFVANNSFDLQHNTNITINAPPAGSFSGGGACIIGGWLLWRDLPQHINDNYPAWIDKAA